MNEDTQNRLAERLGQLLAESPLDNATKEAILERLDEMTEAELFELYDMLKKERKHVANIASQIQMMNSEQEKDWQEVAQNQKTAADNLVKKYVRETEDLKKLEELNETVG